MKKENINLDVKATVTLTEEQVKSILLKGVQDMFPHMITTDVQLNVGKRPRGYGMNEYDEIVFESATVDVAMAKSEPTP